MEINLLNELLTQAEDILFSFNLQEHQISNYQDFRSKVFSQLSVKPKNNIRKLIRDLQGRGLSAKRDSSSQINLYAELDKIFELKNKENQSLIEGIKWESVQRVQKTEQIWKEYREFIKILFIFIEGVDAELSKIVEMRSESRETIDFLENDELEIGKEFDEVMEDIKTRQIKETSHLTELKKGFRFLENKFLFYFERLSAQGRQKDLELARLAESLKENKDRFEEEVKANLDRARGFEETIKKLKEEYEEKYQKGLNKLKQDYFKKEEALIRKNNEEVKEILEEKTKITQKMQKALEDFEKNNEKQTVYISQLKTENIEIQSLRQGLLNQIDKNSAVLEDYKSALEESESNRKYLEGQFVITKDSSKELKKRMQCMEEDFEENLKVVEKKYQNMLEQLKHEQRDNSKELQSIIMNLESEVHEKNREIESLYQKVLEANSEKCQVHEIANNRDLEYEELVLKFKQLGNDNKTLKENLENAWKKIDEVLLASEKCFFMVKKKKKTGNSDYFSELLNLVSELVNDKEWLIRKLEEASKKEEKFLSQDHERDIVNAKSFQAMKSFEKTRAEAFTIIKNK